MDQHLVCPHCNQTVAVSSSLAGQAAQCPYCNGEFSVPSLAPEPQLAPVERRPANPGRLGGNPGRPGGTSGRAAGTLGAAGGYRNPAGAAPRQRANRQLAESSGNSRLLIGVIVALVAACLPIFMFLGYRMLRRSPAVAAAPASSSSADGTQASSMPGDPPSSGAATNAGAAISGQAPTISPESPPVASANNAFAPPAAGPTAASMPPPGSPPPSVAPSVTGSSQNNPGLASPSAASPPVAAAPASPPPSSSVFGGSPSGSGAASEPSASKSPGSTREVVQAVEPSVVIVEVPNVGLGSGFVIDNQGTIATNYHVIEGAKAATITFLTDKATFPVKGFVGIVPGKDLAILKIDLAGRAVKPLPMAPTPPEKGESVLAFGAPKGFGGSVTDGIVSAVRNGSELRDLLQQSTRVDVYTKHLGYDLDAVWIQTNAPISGGNSGGPLVNMRGEVVGLNTWNRTDGQNLNFAISVEHLRNAVQSTQGSLRPLSELPAPRKLAGGGDGSGAPGDAQRTLAYWEQVGKINRAMYKRVKKIARPALPVGGRNPRGFAVKMAAYYRKLAELLPDYAARLKDLDVKDVDVELVALVTADAMIMEGVAEELRSLALSAEVRGSVRVFDTEQIAKKSYSSGGRSIGQAFDVMRINFNLKYGLNFPSIAGDASPSKSAIDDDEEDDDKSKSKAKTDDKSDDPEKASARSLALAKQMLKNPITRDAGIERLEKIIADYPKTAAAEEAKKLLKQFAPEKKSHYGG